MTKRLFEWVLCWQRHQLEKQIGKDFDPDLSRKLDCIQCLLDE